MFWRLFSWDERSGKVREALTLDESHHPAHSSHEEPLEHLEKTHARSPLARSSFKGLLFL